MASSHRRRSPVNGGSTYDRVTAGNRSPDSCTVEEVIVADERVPPGLDSTRWSAVFGLVLDELRAARTSEPLAVAPVEPLVAPAHHAEHAVDEPGEGNLVFEDGR